MSINNSINLNQQGVTYFDGIGTFSGIDASTATFVLTSNGTGVPPSFQAAGGGGSGFTSINVQVFTTSGTYTPTSGMKYCIVEVVGGGGGGGASSTPGSASEACAGGGGGAGGYARSFTDSVGIGASATIAIGAGGAGGVLGGGNGTDGGFTSFAGDGLVLSPTGGTGGNGSTASASGSNSGGLGGSGDGQVNINGQDGQDGNWAILTAGTIGWAQSGSGGSTPLGLGAPGNMTFAGGGAGVNGYLYGSGGSGALAGNSGTAANGGDGQNGIVVVTEFIS